MRWKKKRDPVDGETKWIKKFALFPQLCENEETWVWLESYYCKLMYDQPYEGRSGWADRRIYCSDPFNQYYLDFRDKWDNDRIPPPDVSVVINDLEDKQLLVLLALSPREDMRTTAQERLKKMKKSIKEEEEII